MTPKPHLVGLNLYRALAVILMILAHTARIQTNLPTLQVHATQASLFDQPFLFSLQIEPIISAMFLFIAGFSVVLSKTNAKETSEEWLKRTGRRCLQLYGISVIFFLADQGVQWPDVWVSSGVLSVIAVSTFSSALCLYSGRPWHCLIGLSLAGLATTAVVETQKLSIPGLNAGAGGLLPLVVMTYLGALTGLIRQRWPQYGLQGLLGISLFIGLFALSANYPWVTYPHSSVRIYPGDRIQSVIYSLQDIVGLYNGASTVQTTPFWNHSSIFALRALPLLVLALMIFLISFKKISHSVIKFLDWMGGQALNIYILHLILLAVFEVSNLKPDTGWQTLLIVCGIIALSPLVLRHISFVPFQLSLQQNTPRH